MYISYNISLCKISQMHMTDSVVIQKLDVMISLSFLLPLPPELNISAIIFCC